MSEASKSKLFVSCDLVGSTQFKQSRPGWQKVFLSFYREFPQFVARANLAAHGDDDGEPLAFHLWKAVGDELIFEVHVRAEKDVGAAIRVWLQAMRAYEQESLAEFGLALKGGAFIATFPGPDSESTIPRDPSYEDSDDPVVVLNEDALRGRRAHTKYLYDYFGPSIDTGFRVFGLSSRRYFTLSVEAAWALASAAYAATGDKSGTDTHHVVDVVLHGTHTLKGVWAGREYPVFAIDRDHGDAVNVALAKLRAEEMTAHKIIEVCHACHADPGWPSKLYLPASGNKAFWVVPEDAIKPLLATESPRDVSDRVDGDESRGQRLDESAPLS